jgi:hypothetical protein
MLKGRGVAAPWLRREVRVSSPVVVIGISVAAFLHHLSARL